VLFSAAMKALAIAVVGVVAACGGGGWPHVVTQGDVPVSDGAPHVAKVTDLGDMIEMPRTGPVPRGGIDGTIVVGEYVLIEGADFGASRRSSSAAGGADPGPHQRGRPGGADPHRRRRGQDPRRGLAPGRQGRARHRRAPLRVRHAGRREPGARARRRRDRRERRRHRRRRERAPGRAPLGRRGGRVRGERRERGGRDARSGHAVRADRGRAARPAGRVRHRHRVPE